MKEIRIKFEKKAATYLQLKKEIILRSKIQKKEMEALLFLSQNDEPIRVGDMGAPLNVSQSRITRIMDELVRTKLATRTTSKIDRRSWMATITKKGMELVQLYNAELDKFFDED